MEMLFCEDDSCADKATASVQNTLMPTGIEIVTNFYITVVEVTRKIHPVLRSARTLPGPGVIACGLEDQLLPDLVKPTRNSHGSIRSALALVVFMLIQVGLRPLLLCMVNW